MRREHRRPVDVVGLGAELVERRLRLGVALDGPHAGLALGAGLGEQQGPAVLEAPAGDAAAGLGRLLLVDEQAAALHEVHDEGQHAHVDEQVLAAAPDVDDVLADRLGGVGAEGLQRREGDRREPLEHGAGEGAVEPLGVGLDLGELGHRRVPTPVPAGSTTARRRRRAAARRRPGPGAGRRRRPAAPTAGPSRTASAVARSWVKVTSGRRVRPRVDVDAARADDDVPGSIVVGQLLLHDERGAAGDPRHGVVERRDPRIRTHRRHPAQATDEAH